jgi:hypothetical protein
MEVRRFEKKDTQTWENFVNNSVNGTLFNTRKFLSYHPEDRFKDHSLIFSKKGNDFCTISGIEETIDNKKMFISHKGASYGGFIYDQCSISDAFSIVKSFLNHLKSNNFNGAIITNPPKIYYQKYSDYVDFTLLQNGFKFRKKEISSYLQLPEKFDDAFRDFSSVTRTAIRKSQKQGCVVKQSDDYSNYYRILERNLSLRHNIKPTHTLEELIKIRNLFPQQVILFGAYYREKLIGGIVTFECSKHVNLAFYISGNMDYQYLRPVDLLMSDVIGYSIDKNYRYLDFGLFTVNMEPNFGLGKFKEKFGAVGIFRDTFEIIL